MCGCYYFYIDECFTFVDGVPDPPVIGITENILEWTPPLSRGPAITIYTMEAM